MTSSDKTNHKEDMINNLINSVGQIAAMNTAIYALVKHDLLDGTDLLSIIQVTNDISNAAYSNGMVLINTSNTTQPRT